MGWVIAAATALAIAVTVVLPVIQWRREAARFLVTSDALLRDSKVVLRWSDLLEVAIVTTDDDDVVLLLLDDDGVRVAFRALEVPGPVLDHLWMLPGFDRHAFGEAMRSRTRALFVIWRRAA